LILDYLHYEDIMDSNNPLEMMKMKPKKETPLKINDEVNTNEKKNNKL
jgi:hypothetical protein